jgi:hypothetical protein
MNERTSLIHALSLSFNLGVGGDERDGTWPAASLAHWWSLRRAQGVALLPAARAERGEIRPVGGDRRRGSAQAVHGARLRQAGIARARCSSARVQRHPYGPFADLQRLSRSFFTQRQADAIASLPPAEQPNAFFACWTRKEAVLKAAGLGLTVPLDSVEVSVRPGRCAGVLELAPAVGGGRIRLVERSRSALLRRYCAAWTSSRTHAAPTQALRPNAATPLAPQSAHARTLQCPG